VQKSTISCQKLIPRAIDLDGGQPYNDCQLIFNPPKEDLQMIQRKNLTPLVMFFVVVSLATRLAQAQPADDELYRFALNVILKENKESSEFVVWDRSISSEAITTPRLPNQEPYKQFQRSFSGVGADLENILISVNSDGRDRKMVPFTFERPSMPFSSFVNLTSLKQYELQNKHSLLAIGFSKIAYDPSGRDAILYAEECSPGANDYCNGNGFWFAKRGGKWQLKKTVGFWGGPVKPFWDFE
jgi:hypothetical protein